MISLSMCMSLYACMCVFVILKVFIKILKRMSWRASKDGICLYLNQRWKDVYVNNLNNNEEHEKMQPLRLISYDF